MNITELARRLKITPKELKEKLPELGFDIGKKAIQIPDRQVERVILAWKKAKEEEKKRKKLASLAREEKKAEDTEGIEKKKIVLLPAKIQVYRLAEKLNLPLPRVMSELVKNGILTGLNEEIDYEIAAIVAENLGFQVKKQIKEEKAKITVKEKIKEIIDAEKKEDLTRRPPVIVVMGHVDHGKTLLLDYIRRTNVVSEEKGGITQKIGAYQVKKNNQLLTFIDTPGHKAFESMRARGGEVADLAILVIAADDRIQPQTLEAIRIITKEKLPFLIAINKIDKPEANIKKIKKELSEINLVPEDWGGKTICVPVSAKTGQGIDDLLTNLLLLTDLQEEDLLADRNGKTIATVIESHLDPGLGPVAAVIVFNGLLKKGDMIIIGDSYGKIRNMKNEKGEIISQANLSQPVQIFGLKGIPQVGEILEVIKEPKEFKKRVKKLETLSFKEQLIKPKDREEGKNLRVILRADSLGSLEALVSAIKEIKVAGVRVEIVEKEIGEPTEADILLAQKLKAQVLAFNVGVSLSVKRLAEDLGVNFGSFNVIYKLIETVEEEAKQMVAPKFIKKETGQVKILAVFGKSKKGQICGGRVTKGEIALNNLVEIWRDENLVGQGKIKSLQINKKSVSKIKTGLEAGLLLESEGEIKVGDWLKVYRKEEKVKA